MKKKRIIFALLYANKSFHLSRNFRLQKVGDINWLKKNYDFSKILLAIDELIVMNVDRNNKDIKEFSNCIKSLSANCFIPITAGGGIKNTNEAKLLLRSGADKILLNTSAFNNRKLISELARIFGSQSIIIAVDTKLVDDKYVVFFNNGSLKSSYTLKKYLNDICKSEAGEIYLNSMDRDGTGQGLDFKILKCFNSLSKPLIFSGGVGKKEHFEEGLKNKKIDAISSANLLNFVGDGLIQARDYLLKKKIDIPSWKYTFNLK